MELEPANHIVFCLFANANIVQALL